MPSSRDSAACLRAVLLPLALWLSGVSPAQAFGYVKEGPIWLANSTSSNQVATGDFDGDGAADLMFCYGGQWAWVFSQQADGGLVETYKGPLVWDYRPQPGSPFGYYVYNCRITVADINGDGLDDMFITHGQGVLQLLARPDRGFDRQERVDYVRVVSNAVLDANGDGILDLIVHRSDATGVLSYYPRDADGSFGARTPFKTLDSEYPSSDLAVGDINGDGLPDLAFVGGVTTNVRTGSLEVFINEGSAGFRAVPKLMYPQGALASHVEIGDVTGDGRKDVVVTANAGSAVLVHAQKADGTLAPYVAYGAYAAPMSLALDDMDGDGYTDAVVNNVGEYYGIPGQTGWPGLSTYLQRSGALSFDHQVTALDNNGNEEPDAIAVADLDSNGCKDVIVTGSGTYYRLHGSSCPAAPIADAAVALDTLDWRSIVTLTNKPGSSSAANGVLRVHLVGRGRAVIPSYVPPECARTPAVPGITSFACPVAGLAPGSSLQFQFNYDSKRALDEQVRVVASMDGTGLDPVVVDNRAMASLSTRMRANAPVRPARQPIRNQRGEVRLPTRR